MSGAFHRIGLGLAAVTVVATATPLRAEEISVPVGKAFPFLENFLKLPPAEKTRFRMVYAPRFDGKPLPAQKATLVEANGTRTPLPIGADGYYERTPTLAQLKDARVLLDGPKGAKFGTTMSFVTTLKPSTEYEVRELVATVDETNATIRKNAGPAAMLAPKMGGIAFRDGEGAVAVYPDGRTKPLPAFRNTPVFWPEDFAGAARVRLTKAPSTVRFAPKKK
jgi:hypothetical protein